MVVRLPVAVVGVLVDPDRVGQLAQQLLHAINPGLQVTTAVVRLPDDVDIDTEVMQDRDVRGGRLRIDHAGEPQPVQPGGDGQGDPEVPRAALHEMGSAGNRTIREAPLDEVTGGTVLQAPARVHELKLGDHLDVGLGEEPGQPHQRRVADAGQDGVGQALDGALDHGHEQLL